jgi:putative FmdB family regulatory protein
MPIYAYRCESCGHAKDVLQKISDPVLATCPACNASAFKKQVTAAGFQLKGSGWYVTDFRAGNNGAAKPDAKADGDGKADKADKADSGAKAETTPAAAPAAPAKSAESPAAGSGTTPAASP